MSSRYPTSHQYEPLPIPKNWSNEEKRFAQRLSDLLDDIYSWRNRLRFEDLNDAFRLRFEATEGSVSELIVADGQILAEVANTKIYRAATEADLLAALLAAEIEMYVGLIWLDTTNQIMKRCSVVDPLTWVHVQADEVHTSSIDIQEDSIDIKSTGSINIVSSDQVVVNEDTLTTLLASSADGKTTIYFADEPPSEKEEGDLWYDTNAVPVIVWRWNGADWADVTTASLSAALTAASHAQDTADGKRRVFTATPVPPYDVGDLWSEGSTGDLKRCKTAKAEGGAYSAADWELATKYTDDSSLSTFVSVTYATDKLSLQSQLDSKIESYWLPTASDPSAGWGTPEIKLLHTGDMWYDTTLKKLARWNGTAWEQVVDQQAVDAYEAAEDAQETADGKITTFTGATAPDVAVSNAGDLWFDSDDGNKMYRYSGSAWEEYQDAEIGIIATAVAARTTIFYDDGDPDPPTAYGIGDLWYDIDADPVKIYKWDGDSWEDVTTIALSQALAAAGTAQATADGRIVCFAQSSAVPPLPVATAIGDLWVDTGDNNKIYRAASVGANEIAAGEWVLYRVAAGYVQTSKITVDDDGIDIASGGTLNLSAVDDITIGTAPMRIGGSNLLHNSKEERTVTTDAASEVYISFNAASETMILLPDTEYTVSGWYSATANVSSVDVYLIDETVSAPIFTSLVATAGEYNYFYHVFTTPSAFKNYWLLRFDNNGSTDSNDATLKVKQVKVELGNVPTDYCEADGELANSSIQITDDGITAQTNSFTIQSAIGETLISVAASEDGGGNLVLGSDGTPIAFGGNFVLGVENGGTGVSVANILRGSNPPVAGTGNNGDLYLYHTGTSSGSSTSDSNMTLAHNTSTNMKTYFGKYRNWNREHSTAGYVRIGNGVGAAAYDFGTYWTFTAPTTASSFTFEFYTTKYVGGSTLSTGTTYYTVYCASGGPTGTVIATSSCYANTSLTKQTVMLSASFTSGSTYAVGVCLADTTESTGAAIRDDSSYHVVLKGVTVATRPYGIYLKSNGYWKQVDSMSNYA